MSFSLVSLPHWSARPGPFTKKFTFKPGTEEFEQVVKAVKRAQANQCLPIPLTAGLSVNGHQIQEGEGQVVYFVFIKCHAPSDEIAAEMPLLKQITAGGSLYPYLC